MNDICRARAIRLRPPVVKMRMHVQLVKDGQNVLL